MLKTVPACLVNPKRKVSLFIQYKTTWMPVFGILLYVAIVAAVAASIADEEYTVVVDTDMIVVDMFVVESQQCAAVAEDPSGCAGLVLDSCCPAVN